VGPCLPSRRGNYAIIYAVTIPIFLGFAALVVDLAYMRVARNQAQDIADAASAAAMYTLRRERSRAAATVVAEQTCALNNVAGAPPRCASMEFGDLDNGSFQASANNQAVRVTTDRMGGNAPGLFFARIWGKDTFEVGASAVASSRPLEVIVVLDITVSWDPVNFTLARNAAIGMLDTLATTASAKDRIGLVVFNGSYGWEYTPMTSLVDTGAISSVRDDWNELKLASMAGDPDDCPWPESCMEHKYRWDSTPNFLDFDNPLGGFYPNMPRNYPNELNTDYVPGMLMASTMFDEGQTNAFRGMVVLTDGEPHRVPPHSRDNRLAAGWVEPWRVAEGPVPHTTADIITDTIALAREMWSEQRVHTWFLSFLTETPGLEAVAQGQGYTEVVDQPGKLTGAFQAIAESLPIIITE